MPVEAVRMSIAFPNESREYREARDALFQREIDLQTKKGRDAISQAAPANVDLVRRLFYDPLPVELLAPLTAALEHVNLNLNGSLLPVPN